jgi:hypothetical protein
LPWILDMRPWRCKTCAKYFAVTPADVRRSFPSVLRSHGERQRPVFLTRRFLLHLVQKLFELLNASAVKRHLYDYYLANAQALCLSERSLWFTSSVPRLRPMRLLLLKALQSYLPEFVAEIEKVVHVYAGSGVRGDGHYKVATRIIAGPAGKIGCIYAWVSVDGSLLRPPSALPDEKLATVISDLDPLADDMLPVNDNASFVCKFPSVGHVITSATMCSLLISCVVRIRNRIAAGLHVDEAVPSFHATDS